MRIDIDIDIWNERENYVFHLIKSVDSIAINANYCIWKKNSPTEECIEYKEWNWLEIDRCPPFLPLNFLYTTHTHTHTHNRAKNRKRFQIICLCWPSNAIASLCLFIVRRLMIKWNCCKIHGLTCLYWIIYIIDCTTIYQMRHHCIMVKSSICWAWDCWAFHNWPTTSMKYKTNCMSWNSMLVTTFAWNFCYFWIQVSEKFPEFHYFFLWFFIHFINQNPN